MDLKIKDIVNLLQVPEKTVRQWIKDHAIPYHQINHRYRFNRAEINEWILDDKPDLASKLLDLSIAGRPTHFTDLLRSGGIYYGIPGRTVKEILHAAIEAIQTPAPISKEDILAALINREMMMTTAIGRGIAIPHPRHPIITKVEDARVSLCFLKDPADFGALDGRPVHTLFLLLTDNPRRHLEVLSKISYLCQLPDFLRRLENRAPENELLEFIGEREREWREKGSNG
ncbi:MAG: PTS sugar transporter subunit IIA [Candidatus Aminicenantales bacterium]